MALTDRGSVAAPSFGTIALWYCAIFLISQWPLYGMQYVDIRDFANHAARLHVLVNLDDHATLQQYYARTIQFSPNFVIDALGYVLARLFGVELGLKVFSSASTALLTTGAMALGRALAGRVTYLSLGALLFANGIFFYFGLFNYLFGLGLAFWLLAAWLLAPRQYTLARVALFSVGTVVLYVCHLAALGVYAIGVACFELTRISSAPALRPLEQVRRVAIAAAQFAPAAALHLWVTGPSIDRLPMIWEFGWENVFAYKLAILLRMPTAVFSIYSVSGLLVCISLLLLTFVASRRRLLRISPAGQRISVGLLIAIVALPPVGPSLGLVDSRLMLPLAIVLCCSLDVSHPAIAWSRLAPAVIAAGVAGIAGEQVLHWYPHAVEQKALRSALAGLPVGARIATVALDSKRNSDRISEHAAGWAVIDRDAFLSSIFARPFVPFYWIGYRAEYQPLAALARFEPSSRPTPTFAQLESHFEYIIAFGSRAETAAYAAGAKSIYATDAVRIAKP